MGSGKGEDQGLSSAAKSDLGLTAWPLRNRSNHAGRARTIPKMRFRITATIAIFILTSLITLGQDAAAKADKKDWIQLFNGKDLDGWTVKIAKHKLGENFGDTFRVKDGLLTVSYDQYDKFDGQFGHL